MGDARHEAGGAVVSKPYLDIRFFDQSEQRVFFNYEHEVVKAIHLIEEATERRADLLRLPCVYLGGESSVLLISMANFVWARSGGLETEVSDDTQ